MPTDTLVISFPTSFFQFKFLSKIRFFSSRITANGSRLCDGGEIEAEKLNLLLMFNQGTNVEISSKAPLLQN
ncbi:hypothetical protein, partial [Chryseobacterium indologenes]|uniref:hypothetical protein n=1 Tax=Chryseobacterium indologenes TaxID=253 RepID=UPI001E52A455